MKIRMLYYCAVIGWMCWLFLVWGVFENGKINLVRGADQVKETSGNAKEEEQIGFEKMKIALTFDDGPNQKSTPVLLDGLAARNVKASFFVIGENAARYPELIEREITDGHVVGNHTYHHVELTKLTEEEATEEICKTNEVIASITGKQPEFMRPPYGAWKKTMEEKTEMMPVLWSVDPLDWKTDDASEIVKKVVTETGENDIILLHDCYESSVNAALRIVDILQTKGYVFVTVDELMLD